MSNTGLHLMAFVPKPGVTTEVYTVGMPDDLRDALFRLFPTKHYGDYLYTKQLKPELDSWLDEAVAVRGVRQGEECPDWLVALRPVDPTRLCNIIANWVTATCSDDARKSDAYAHVMSMLKPECFARATGRHQVRLFDELGRPSAESQGLAFSAFSVQVANALVGRRFVLPGGVSLVFNRISRGTKNEYELMSNVLWCDADPYAVVLHFHVETLPRGQRARLNLDVKVRSFITGTWRERLYLKTNVRALVRTDSGCLRPVPYGYSGESRRLDWDRLAKMNYEIMGHRRLPELQDYLADMAAYADGGHEPQILSPRAAQATWARDSAVKSGMPMADKAAIFNMVAEGLSEFVVPEAPLASVNLARLHAAYEEPGPKLKEEQPDRAEEQGLAWAASNRRRVAAATGERTVLFEIVGTNADGRYFDLIRREIEYTLGPEGDYEGLSIEVREVVKDHLLAPLDMPGEAGSQARWRRVERELARVPQLTACVVLLPGAKAFLDENGISKDPKAALRMGFARSGRLAQFLIPEKDDVRGEEAGALEHRIRSSVRDLLRQLGLVPELDPKSRSRVSAIPVTGLYLYEAPRDKLRAKIPLAVRMEPRGGRVTVDCPLFRERRLPYWKAQLELARISTSGAYREELKSATGRALKRMVDVIKDEAVEESLLLVQSRGSIRSAAWWPGVSDARLAQGPLRYGPTKVDGAHVEDDLFDTDGCKLSVLRVRSGADGEVPDYFTDPKEGCENEAGASRRYHAKQGMFRRDGYVLALTSKPNSPEYTMSLHRSKFDNPGWRFAEKTLNEYCLLTSDDMDAAMGYARYAEALRGSIILYAKSDMKINLPAPLHLASRLEEYIWAPGGRKGDLGNARGRRA